jgi:1-acyl-sn-glycerol-3-phosphate acyltransferase
VSRTWARRAATIPGLFVALALVTCLAPLLVLLALTFDAVRGALRGTPWMASRLLAFAWVYLANEAWGLVALGALWIVAGVGPARRQRLVDWTYAVQRAWAGVLFASSRALLGLRYEVEGGEHVRPGPLLVFVQHASLLDTLVPTIFITARHGIRLRFVLKKELLVSPCLDVAGQRLPNVFVDRSASQTEREVSNIRALASGLGPSEGVIVYPEGTRFTPKKKARALERLAASDPALHARAARLAHVLPPRLGGPLAMLEGAPDADCLFVAHRGLEGFAHYEDMLSGGLVNGRVRVQMWRVPRAEVPMARDARVVWLYDAWQRVDDWHAREREETRA